ncbi:GNAT family N-acetyltransferase [Metabacillus sp. 113a]|uniref:GNAT family N-acetyltransferase n=1 Tax=Metabacillus sp. 113a TaxID=3404706 RepID=UPI003CEA70EC
MIRLVPFTMGDADELIHWIPSEDFLMQWGGPEFVFPLTKGQIQNYLGKENQLVFTAKNIESGLTVGHICISRIDAANKSCRISKVLVGSPETRGKGYGQKMIKGCLDIAFRELEFRRITLAVFDFNEQAINCYSKAGFQIEGHAINARKVNQSFWSLYEMGITREGWEQKNRSKA